MQKNAASAATWTLAAFAVQLAAAVCVDIVGRLPGMALMLLCWLMNAYDLSADQVKEHYDFSGKNCPQTIRENGRMEEFVALAEQYAQQAKEQED